MTAPGVVPQWARFDVHGHIPVGTVPAIVVEGAINPFRSTIVKVE